MRKPRCLENQVAGPRPRGPWGWSPEFSENPPLLSALGAVVQPRWQMPGRGQCSLQTHEGGCFYPLAGGSLWASMDCLTLSHKAHSESSWGEAKHRNMLVGLAHSRNSPYQHPLNLISL